MKLVALILVVAGCANDSTPTPPPAPAPPPSAPTGTIRGSVHVSMSGPGRVHSPQESFTHTGAVECSIELTGPVTKTLATNKDSGTFEARVPIGHYQVSFASCSPCCAGSTTIEVDVLRDAVAKADWGCTCQAK